MLHNLCNLKLQFFLQLCAPDIRNQYNPDNTGANSWSLLEVPQFSIPLYHKLYSVLSQFSDWMPAEISIIIFPLFQVYHSFTKYILVFLNLVIECLWKLFLFYVSFLQVILLTNMKKLYFHIVPLFYFIFLKAL